MSLLHALIRLLTPKPAHTAELRVHLYALCWNEARMLPFFFRHYDALVDQYFIFDNGSTDDSLHILRSHPRVTLGEFRVEGPSFVFAAQQFYNQCWKASRGKADWVIVCNIDEHLYHPDLKDYLRDCRQKGLTLITPEGYEMVSEHFPPADRLLCQEVRQGARSLMMDKPQLFSPNHLREINFAPGRHRAKPRGRVRRPAEPRVKLLHYKYLGLGYLSARLSELKGGLREQDIALQMGHKYLWDDPQKAADFEAIRTAAVEVI